MPSSIIDNILLESAVSAQAQINGFNAVAKGVEMTSGAIMTQRIRHCVFCTHCLTRYLIGFSPYGNGSYLESTVVGSLEEYILYCSCRQFPAPSRWRDSETRTCVVTNSAYCRGYGSPEEVWFTDHGGEQIDLFAESTLKARRYHEEY